MPGSPAAASAAGPATPAEALRTKPYVRVLVELADPRPAGEAADSAASLSAIADLQTAVLRAVFGAQAAREGAGRYAVRRLASIPAFAVNVNRAELARLEADPRVRAVGLDRALRPLLLQSTPQIQMNLAWAAPYRALGAGQSVAVVDTGVNLQHKFLARQRIIAQACFSGGGNPSDSFCPNGQAVQIGGNAGRNCPVSFHEGCAHGTHVAGIAAGFNTDRAPGEPTRGVAFRGRIVAVQVFSPVGGEPRAFDSDILSGLDWLFLNRNTFTPPLAAINMSLGGGGPFTANCNKDPSVGGPIYKLMFDRLRNAGIATVVASGNEGFTNGVASPACISSAVTVGATTKTALGQPEQLAFYSNMGQLVDLLAPGGQLGGGPVGPYPVGTSFTPGILSSVPGNRFESFQGTSMAAPHVAGVFAAIRSAQGCESKTVTEIETALKQTGTNIRSSGFTKRRVNVQDALERLGCQPRATGTSLITAGGPAD